MASHTSVVLMGHKRTDEPQRGDWQARDSWGSSALLPVAWHLGSIWRSSNGTSGEAAEMQSRTIRSQQEPQGRQPSQGPRELEGGSRGPGLRSSPDVFWRSNLLIFGAKRGLPLFPAPPFPRSFCMLHLLLCCLPSPKHAFTCSSDSSLRMTAAAAVGQEMAALCRQVSLKKGWPCTPG